jgi:hypothetical protein
MYVIYYVIFYIKIYKYVCIFMLYSYVKMIVCLYFLLVWALSLFYLVSVLFCFCGGKRKKSYPKTTGAGHPERPEQ